MKKKYYALTWNLDVFYLGELESFDLADEIASSKKGDFMFLADEDDLRSLMNNISVVTNQTKSNN